MVTDSEVKRVVALGRIDRSSAIPLYHQLEYLIRQEIESGRYRPGDPLPSEGEICARFEVSRSVVRQTLTNLTHAGMVRTERGRGSFVAEKKLPERFVQRTTGLYDDLRRMGYDIRTRVVRQAVAELPLPVQEFLQVKDGVQIDRVRSVDGRVLAFIRSFVPVARCPGLAQADLADRSLYQVLAGDHGLQVGSGRRTVEAVAARDEVAAHLGVAEGEPLLLLRSASRDEQGEPLEWFEAWHRGDRTMLEIEVVAGEVDQPVSSVVRPRRQVTQRVPAPGPAPSAREVSSGREVPAREVSSGREVRSAREVPSAREMSAALRHSRVLAVLRAERYGAAAGTAQVLAGHGLNVIEVSLNGDAALAAIREISEVPGVVVGAGTVTAPAAAQAAVAAGAQFLVAPLGAQAALSEVGPVPLLLTGFTLNEVYAAWQATTMPVMVFPASASGPGYMSTLVGQIPDVPLLPAGGVDLDNAADYLAAGAMAVAIGQSLCPTEALPGGDLDVIAARAQRLTDNLARPVPATRSAARAGSPA